MELTTILMQITLRRRTQYTKLRNQELEIFVEMIINPVLNLDAGMQIIRQILVLDDPYMQYFHCWHSVLDRKFKFACRLFFANLLTFCPE